MTPKDLSPNESELLRLLAREQARYEARDGWDFKHTLWSRVSYLMAKERGRLTPTHIPGKFDMDRKFETTFRRVVERLIKRKLVRMKPIGSGKQPTQTLGYKRHEARGKDVFLTDAGKAVAAALQEALQPPPDGDVGGPTATAPSVPPPDGDVGYPAAPEAAADAEAAAPQPAPVQERVPPIVEAPTVTPASTEPAAGPRRPRQLERPRAQRTQRRAGPPRPRRTRRRG